MMLESFIRFLAGYKCCFVFFCLSIEEARCTAGKWLCTQSKSADADSTSVVILCNEYLDNYCVMLSS